MEKMYPIENTLCVFNAKEDKNIFILGYLYFSLSDREFVIKKYGIDEIFSADHFDRFQYVLNEKGGTTTINQLK